MIEPLSQEEFDATPGSRSPRSAETQAVETLAPLEGIKLPCRWEHWKHQCYGLTILRRVARKAGFKIATRCREGIVYIFRDE